MEFPSQVRDKYSIARKMMSLSRALGVMLKEAASKQAKFEPWISAEDKEDEEDNEFDPKRSR
jgi:hypothetical protein